MKNWTTGLGRIANFSYQKNDKKSFKMEKLTYLEPSANLDYFSDMKNKKMGNND